MDAPCDYSTVFKSLCDDIHCEECGVFIGDFCIEVEELVLRCQKCQCEFRKETRMMKFYKTKEMSVNELGEWLRDEFFDQSFGLGCYGNFVMREGVKHLGEENIFDEGECVGKDRIYEKEIDGQIFMMKYSWDGDGYLEFTLPDGSEIRNSDCKKTNRWKG
jgi:hypothetical protein